MVQDKAILTTANQWKVVYGLSNAAYMSQARDQQRFYNLGSGS